MPVSSARDLPWRPFLKRAGRCVGLAALLLIFGSDGLQNAVAEGDTRTLSFHHVHTDEDITVTFKRNGRYDEAALKKLDWFMRDWRREQDTHMDPHLFDLLWEAYREIGAKEPIQVICGYRSPETNTMLRARSNGVAQFSLHTQGDAMDFYIPGVALEDVRTIGLRLQRGGVGFYPTSGSPFVHLDTGSVRHWPRMTHEQLVKVFPNERTVHIPSDGQPLAGYALALAEVERRGGTPSPRSLETARNAGAIGDDDVNQTASVTPKRGLLARMFGFGKDDGASESRTSSKPAPTAVARAKAPVVAAADTVPLPTARPKPIAVASILPPPRPARAAKPVVMASNDVIAARGYWRGPVETGPVLSSALVSSGAADLAVTGSTAATALATALAYAAVTGAPATQRVSPMGRALPRMPVAALVVPAAADASVVVKQASAQAETFAAMPIGVRFDQPWLRATMLTPSAQTFMTSTRLGAAHQRPLGEFLRKPASSLVMTFSDDPHYGMVAEHFSGSAVVFLATTSFNTRTASLR